MNRLITHGCSFTYGQELEDPSSQSWPALVAKSLNLELLNLAEPGYANDGVIENLIAQNIDPNNDLIIVMWTWQHRLMLVDEEGWFTCFPENSDEGMRQTISKLLVSVLDEKWLFNRWLTQIILLQEYFKSRGIKYLFTLAFDNIDETFLNSPLINQIDTKFFLGWPHFNFASFSFENHTFLPLGHPNAEAHAAFSNIILDKIKEIYEL